MKSKSFAYVNLILQNSRGIVTKLEEQAEACLKQELDMDVLWLTRDLPTSRRESGLTILSMGSGTSLSCRFKQMKELNDLRRRYRGILLRYPVCDPATLIAMPKCDNLASEHHTKEVQELTLNRDSRALLERWFGRAYLRRFSAFFAVTEEILGYERARVGKEVPGFVVHNAISLDRIPPQTRDPALFSNWPKVKFVIASSIFNPWHGLDLILEGFKRESLGTELHICGEISPALRTAASSIKNVVLHGRLDLTQLMTVYSQCDIGISSFALFRNGLTQASTLKVREYLACGLPVVLGHLDTGIPAAFPYALVLNDFEVGSVLSWCNKIKHVNRNKVFCAAEGFISIDRLVRDQVSGLSAVF